MSNGSQMHSAVATCPNACPKNQGQCAYVSPPVLSHYTHYRVDIASARMPNFSLCPGFMVIKIKPCPGLGGSFLTDSGRSNGTKMCTMPIKYWRFLRILGAESAVQARKTAEFPCVCQGHHDFLRVRDGFICPSMV